MKLSRKKLTFIPVLVLISAIIFPSFTALAADASYKFSAIDLKLKVGAGFKVEWKVPIITTSSYKNIGIGRGTSTNAVSFKATIFAIGKWK